MKRILFPMFVLAGFSTAALGQGTIVIANNLGATIYPVCFRPDGSVWSGSDYSVEIFVNNTEPANKIGTTMTLSAVGRFSLSGSQVVPGVAPGSIATLIARAWDNRTGATYDSALIRGYGTFKSPVLGGDIDGDPSTPPAPALPMVTGKPDGFQSICIPEPRSVLLLLVGVGAPLVEAARRGRPDGDAKTGGR